MSSALIQIDKKFMLLKSIQHSFNIFNINDKIFEINQNIIQIYYDVHIESFRERFIDVNLK